MNSKTVFEIDLFCFFHDSFSDSGPFFSQTLQYSLNQVDEPSAETPGCDNDAGASSSVYSPAGSDSELDTVEVVQAKRLSLKYVLIVIVVVSVIYLLNQEPFPIEDL